MPSNPPRHATSESMLNRHVLLAAIGDLPDLFHIQVHY